MKNKLKVTTRSVYLEKGEQSDEDEFRTDIPTA